MLFTLLLVPGFLLLAILIAGLTYWSAVAVRIMKGNRQQPRLGDATGTAPEELGRLSIVVPAHNEERVIEQCVRSLRAQDYPDLEIVFVLDRCTDRTAEILTAQAAEDPRIVIVTNDACPDDWAGKCNAAALGAARATGEWILFTDADTVFDPALSRAAVSLALRQDAALLSLLTTLTCRHYHEYVAQPVAAFILLHVYPAVRMSRRRAPRPFANGQFMLFRRDWYDRVGGHAGVRDELLEDLAFARAVVEHGGRLVVASDAGMCRCAMYDSLAAFEQGWRRIFIEAVKRKPGDLRRYSRRVAALAVQPLLTLAAIAVALGLFAVGDFPLPTALVVLAAAVSIMQAAALLLVYPRVGAPAWSILLFPLGARIVSRVLRGAARDLEERRCIQWGGREYVFQPRETGERRETFTLQKEAAGVEPRASARA